MLNNIVNKLLRRNLEKGAKEQAATVQLPVTGMPELAISPQNTLSPSVFYRHNNKGFESLPDYSSYGFKKPPNSADVKPLLYKGTAPDPGMPEEVVDLAKAVQQFFYRVGSQAGIEHVMMTGRYNWLDYSSPEYPDFAQHHFAWLEIEVVKDKVHYSFDFNVIDESNGLWNSANFGQPIVSIEAMIETERRPMFISALQAFYLPEDLRKLNDEYTPQELMEENKRVATRRGWPEFIRLDRLTFSQDLAFQDGLKEAIANAPEVKAVIEKYDRKYVALHEVQLQEIGPQRS